MATNYTGIASTARLNTKALLNSASMGPPIGVTTTAPHGFQTGDQVFILGVVGNTAANCPQNVPWTISVTGPSSFTLNGSTGNAPYVSGGTAYNVAFNPAFQVPSDLDTFNAAAWNVGLEAVADRTALLAQILQPRPTALGTSAGGQLIAQYAGGASDDTWAAWSTATPGVAGWALANNGDQIAMSSFNIRCNTGDFFDCFFSIGEATAATNPAPFAIGAQFSASGAGFTQGISAKRVLQGLTMPVELRGNFTTVSGGGGTVANVTTVAGGVATITGLSGMIAGMVGNSLTLRGCAAAGNNGTYPIATVPSANSVTIRRP